MKIAAAVILYYPDKNVSENIVSYSYFTEKTYILDNSENLDESIYATLKKINNTQYFNDGENQGIAVRLNQIARLAISEGFDYLLTMDQDSHFSKINIEQYLSCVSEFKDKDKVSMFGVKYDNSQNTGNICKPQEAPHLITSGSLLNLKLYKKTDGFDEQLFIDEVDLEYCYQSILKGFKIIRFSNIFLNHELGKISYHRSFKNLASTPRMLHSPLRLYYMVRNHLYLSKKYKSHFPEDIKEGKGAILNRIKNNLLYGKEKLNSMKHILRAYRDFKRNKMGKKN
jgi:rhamnosyltransferase